MDSNTLAYHMIDALIECKRRRDFSQTPGSWKLYMAMEQCWYSYGIWL